MDETFGRGIISILLANIWARVKFQMHVNALVERDYLMIFMGLFFLIPESVTPSSEPPRPDGSSESSHRILRGLIEVTPDYHQILSSLVRSSLTYHAQDRRVRRRR